MEVLGFDPGHDVQPNNFGILSVELGPVDYCFHIIYVDYIRGLTYFRAYEKRFMQINKFLCIMFWLVKVYEKTTYEDTIFINENL